MPEVAVVCGVNHRWGLGCSTAQGCGRSGGGMDGIGGMGGVTVFGPKSAWGTSPGAGTVSGLPFIKVYGGQGGHSSGHGCQQVLVKPKQGAL